MVLHKDDVWFLIFRNLCYNDCLTGRAICEFIAVIRTFARVLFRVLVNNSVCCRVQE